MHVIIKYLFTWADSASGSGDLFLISPSNKTVTEMDKAVFVCVPADSMLQVTWSSNFPSFVTGPNNYYLLVENVSQTAPVSCSIDNSITAYSILTVQGFKLMYIYVIMLCTHIFH